MPKAKKIHYSSIKRKIFPEKFEKNHERLAEITHYLQKNSHSIHFDKKPLKNYVSDIAPSIINDPEFQYELKIDWDIPFPPQSKPKFEFIDLFAGIGGIRMAFQELGGKCVFTSEWNAYSKKTYETNFGEVHLEILRK